LLESSQNAGRSLAAIKQSWEKDLLQFGKRRASFLIYK